MIVVFESQELASGFIAGKDGSIGEWGQITEFSSDLRFGDHLMASQVDERDRSAALIGDQQRLPIAKDRDRPLKSG